MSGTNSRQHPESRHEQEEPSLRDKFLVGLKPLRDAFVEVGGGQIYMQGTGPENPEITKAYEAMLDYCLASWANAPDHLKNTINSFIYNEVFYFYRDGGVSRLLEGYWKKRFETGLARGKKALAEAAEKIKDDVASTQSAVEDVL